MPAERVAMRQVREIIRLKLSTGIPTREIARRLGVAASTVRETLRRFEGAGLGWPLPDGMSDGDLEAALYANHGTKRGHRRHAEPDWPTVHRELKRKHVTLVIVWDEYIAANLGGYSYSRFCELYRGFESKARNPGGIIPLRWAASFRNPGRHYPVVPGRLRRNPHIEHMSAGLPPITDITRRGWHGRKVPLADVHRRSRRIVTEPCGSTRSTSVDPVHQCSAESYLGM